MRKLGCYAVVEIWRTRQGNRRDRVRWRCRYTAARGSSSRGAAGYTPSLLWIRSAYKAQTGFINPLDHSADVYPGYMRFPYELLPRCSSESRLGIRFAGRSILGTMPPTTFRPVPLHRASLSSLPCPSPLLARSSFFSIPLTPRRLLRRPLRLSAGRAGITGTAPPRIPFPRAMNLLSMILF